MAPSAPSRRPPRHRDEFNGCPSPSLLGRCPCPGGGRRGNRSKYFMFSSRPRFDFKRIRFELESAPVYCNCDLSQKKTSRRLRIWMQKNCCRSKVCFQFEVGRAGKRQLCFENKPMMVDNESSRAGVSFGNRPLITKSSRKELAPLSLSLLHRMSDMPLYRAAEQLGMSTSYLKTACRRLGISRWPRPGRKIGPSVVVHPQSHVNIDYSRKLFRKYTGGVVVGPKECADKQQEKESNLNSFVFPLTASLDRRASSNVYHSGSDDNFQSSNWNRARTCRSTYQEMQNSNEASNAEQPPSQKISACGGASDSTPDETVARFARSPPGTGPGPSGRGQRDTGSCASAQDFDLSSWFDDAWGAGAGAGPADSELRESLDAIFLCTAADDFACAGGGGSDSIPAAP